MKLSDRARVLRLPRSFESEQVRDIALALGLTYHETLKFLADQRQEMLRTPTKGERCFAFARSTGKPCRAPALANGRCRMHGGLSTGATSREGQLRSYGRVRCVNRKAINIYGGVSPCLIEHIVLGGELSAEQRAIIRQAECLDLPSYISALELADVVIADNLQVLVDAVEMGYVNPQWFDRWFARKRRQVDEQKKLLLRLRESINHAVAEVAPLKPTD